MAIDPKALELARTIDASDAGYTEAGRYLAHQLLAAAAELERMAGVVERASLIVRDFRDDIERASRYRATRGMGGQQVSPTHEFAAVPPSGLSAMHRVARALTMALGSAQVSLATTTPPDGAADE